MNLINELKTKLVLNRINGNEFNTISLEKTLAIPEWLINVKNTFYNELPETIKNSFIINFFEAANEAKNLNKIEAKFHIYILKSNFDNFDSAKYPDVKKAIETVIELYETGNLEQSEKWSAAESAAASAARSAAKSAAWSAARSAAWSAAWSVARSAARSAAVSAAASAAVSAAWSAAESAAYQKYADKLIELIRECK